MLLKRFLVLFLIIISIFSFTQCTSRYSQTSSDKQLISPNIAKAKISPISLQIPFGWKEINANDSTFIDLWLVSEDFKSSLSLIPLNNDSKDQNLEQWKFISKLSNKMKYKNSGVEFIDEDSIELNEITIAIYKFTHKDHYYRVCIFEHQKRFYELTALEENEKNIAIISDIQNSVLASLK